MPLRRPPTREPFLTKEGISRSWREWIDETRTFINTHDNVLPEGVIVDESAAQTLTNKTLSQPTLTEPTVADFTQASHDHSDAPGGGVIAAQDHGGLTGLGDDDHSAVYMHLTNNKAAAQGDASALTAISAGAGGDSIDLATFNTDLGTLVSEVDAIKDIVNALIDKLQAAGLMA